MNPQKLPVSFMLSLVVMVLVCYLPNTAAGANTTLSLAAAGQSLDDSPRLVLFCVGSRDWTNGGKI
jgi:hypothetical protein